MNIVKKIKYKYEKYKMANSPSCVFMQNSKVAECLILGAIGLFEQIEKEVEKS